MTTDEAIAVFSSCSSEEKKVFVAHLMHELTVVARDSYEVGAASGCGAAPPECAARCGSTSTPCCT